MAAAYKNYYEILGVNRQATEADIKTAYRKAARNYHPDLHAKNEKAAAEEKFKEINEAYAVLGDAEKRAQYDRIGEKAGSGQEWQPAPDMGAYGRRAGYEANVNGFSDFFESLFGGMASNEARGSFRKTRNTRGQDLESEIALTLEEAYHGGQKTLQFAFRSLCPVCAGTGVAGQNICSNCTGTGEKMIEKTLDVKIPAFIRDGNKIRLKGQGGEGSGNGNTGDLLLTVKIQPHAIFTLNGTCLETTIKIRPEQAVLGGQMQAPTIDGEVRMTIPPMTHNGQKLRLRSKGWPAKNGARGDEFVQIVIDIPHAMDAEEKELYRRLAEKRGLLT
jgi:curved DNA-binding protein